MSAGSDDYRGPAEQPPRVVFAKGQSVSLGCGTLILIALIVLFFSQGTSHEIEQQVRGVRSEVAEVKKAVDALRAKEDADAAVAVNKGPVSPYCVMERFEQHDLNNRIRLKTWDLKAHGLKRLSVRLVEITSGKARTANDTTYQWDAWPKSAAACSGSILLLSRPDQGKVLYSLSVDLKNSPGHLRSAMEGEAVVDATLLSMMRSTRNVAGPLPDQVPALLDSELLGPANDLKGFTTNGQIDGLTKASEGGRAAIAVTLEWSPQ
jgi:hypothetical protein